jgi:hypothetical protein
MTYPATFRARRQTRSAIQAKLMSVIQLVKQLKRTHPSNGQKLQSAAIRTENEPGGDSQKKKKLALDTSACILGPWNTVPGPTCHVQKWKNGTRIKKIAYANRRRSAPILASAGRKEQQREGPDVICKGKGNFIQGLD